MVKACRLHKLLYYFCPVITDEVREEVEQDGSDD